MNKALLVIGFQNSYSDKDGGFNNKVNYALQSTSRIIGYFRNKKLPIFYIVDHFSDIDNLFSKNIPELLPLDNEIIMERKKINCFYETDLHKKLQELKIDELIICGMLTDLVIDTTVRCAKDLEYNVTLISDACVARDLEINGIRLPSILVNNVFLGALQNDYAQIVSSIEYIRKQNEEFVLKEKPIIEENSANILNQNVNEEIVSIENQDAITIDDLKDLESVDEEYLVYEYDK